MISLPCLASATSMVRPRSLSLQITTSLSHWHFMHLPTPASNLSLQLTSSASLTANKPLTPPHPKSHCSYHLHPDLHYHYAFTSFSFTFHFIVLHWKHFLPCTFSHVLHSTGGTPILITFNFLPFLILASVQLNTAEEEHSHAHWSPYDHQPQKGINDAKQSDNTSLVYPLTQCPGLTVHVTLLHKRLTPALPSSRISGIVLFLWGKQTIKWNCCPPSHLFISTWMDPCGLCSALLLQVKSTFPFTTNPST